MLNCKKDEEFGPGEDHKFSSGVGWKNHCGVHTVECPSWLRLSRIWLPCRRPGFYPWVGQIPGERSGYPLRYSGLENSMDRGAWGLQSSGSQRVRHYWAQIERVRGEYGLMHTHIHTVVWLDNSRKEGTTAEWVSVNESHNHNIEQKTLDTKQALLCASVYIQFKAKRRWSEGSEVRMIWGVERESGD